MSADLCPELQAELVSFVRRLADWSRPASYTEDYADARILAAKLPPPVDTDVDEARKIVATAWHCLPCELPENSETVEVALNAIKRGRELERGQPA